MHGRLSTYEGPADELTRGFEGVTSDLEQLEGLKGAYFGVDRDGGTAFSLTLWESEEALEASVERANQMRDQASQQAGGTIKSVQHFEITVTAGGV